MTNPNRDEVKAAAKFFDEIATYDELTGMCHYKVDRMSGWYVSHVVKAAGEQITSPNRDGYYRIKIEGIKYRLHRLIWIHFYGPIPDGMMIDHKNQDRNDNRLENMRLATTRQNAANMSKLVKPTSSQYKGVCWYKPSKKWISRITINGKDTHLGYFASEVEAAKAYNVAAVATFGEYASLNIIPISIQYDRQASSTEETCT